MPLVDTIETFQMTNVGTHIDGTDVYQSNRNLLDNPFFTIDQTSVTSGAADAAIDARDRWRVARCASYAFNDDGTITTAWNGNGRAALVLQYALLDTAKFWVGKEVTFSGYVDGVLHSVTFNVPTGQGNTYTLGDGVSLYINNFVDSNRGIEIQVCHNSTTGKTLGPFKLEKGSISTLPNDGPPDYQKELAKCQRVFIRLKGEPIATGYLSTNKQYAYMLVPTSGPMRSTPTVSYSGTFSIRIYNDTKTATAMTAATPLYTAGGVGLRVTLNSTASAYGPCGMFAGSTSDYIDLSCRPS